MAEPRGGVTDSMSPLQDIFDHPVDPDYEVAAARAAQESAAPTGRRLGARWVTLAAVGAFALLLTVAAVQTRVDEPEAAREKAALIQQIEERKSSIAAKQHSVGELSASVAALGGDVDDAATAQAYEDQRLITGADAATGPGVRIVVDSSEDSDQKGAGRVRDTDLQLLVNGLWQSGAEAVAINGKRLTALSSIRTAGSAITVNYVSLDSPYTVSAIGDPQTLASQLLESSGGQTWLTLRANLGMRFEMDQADELDLPSAPQRRMRVRVAEPVAVDR